MPFSRIYRSLELGEGESAHSFVSRLAVRSGCSNAMEFCAAHGALFGHVLVGRDDTIRSLSEAADVDHMHLLANSFRKGEDGFTLGGVPLPKSALSRSEIRACAMCLANDARGARNPATAAFGRGWWHVASLRTCPEHGLALATLTHATEKTRSHDLARRYEPFLSRLDRLAFGLAARKCSRLEDYLRLRLRARDTGDPFLDGLPLHVVAKTSEAIGYLETIGQEVPWCSVDSDGWWRAGGVGFSVLAGGPDAFEQWIKQRRGSPGRASHSPDLGAFYRWLTHAGPAFDPIRDIAAEQVFSTTALPAGTVVFGRALPDRRFWSVTSAANKFGLTQGTVSRLLTEAGVIPNDLDAPFEATLFAANEQNDLILRKAANSVNLAKLQQTLGLTRKEALSLVGAEMISPIVSQRNNGAFRFWNNDIVDFSQRMISSATEVEEFPKNFYAVGLRHAARYFSMTFADLASEILSGHLPAFRLRGVDTIPEIHVDLDSVMKLRANSSGFSFNFAAKYFGIGCQSLDALISSGHLIAVRSPPVRGKYRLIDASSIILFEKNYIIVSSLARKIGVQTNALHAALRRRGVQSTFVTGGYYRRLMNTGRKNPARGCHLYKIDDLKSIAGSMVVLKQGKKVQSQEELQSNTIIF
ncbi:TniQ family protein [Methylobacterium sp. C1]|uniref:TniQ family protein n=1 Tax=Methylobacterium sp. C1 TaxID=1479019 RepID=UPI0009F67565|nr:TniQ family protein [Methylobacterium sp. C1]